MRRIHREIVTGFAIASLLLATGCASNATSNNNNQASQGANNGTTSVGVDTSNADVTDVATLLTAVVDAEDNQTDITGAFNIQTEDGAIKQSGNTYTLTAGGTYTLSGRLEDGQILIDASEDAKVELILQGAYIACSTGSPICAIQADDVKVKVEEGTYNEIRDQRDKKADSDSGSDTEEEEIKQKAAIYADCDLSIVGKGTLLVTASYHNGIHSTDDLKIKNVTLKVTAVHHALRGKDSVVVESGNLTLKGTQADGINSDTLIQIDGGAIQVTAGDDGMHADKELVINGGSIQVTESTEGLEAVILTINDGVVVVYGKDDGLNACTDDTRSTTPTITINGGYVDVTTPSGDTDAVDSNGNFIMNGGYALIKGGSNMGSMAGSVDVDGSITVNAGTIIAVGGICETPENEINGYAASSTQVSAGTYVVKADDGTVVTGFIVSSTYSGFWMASDQLKTNTTYSVASDQSTILTWTQSAGMQGDTGMGGNFPGGGNGNFPGGGNGNHPGGGNGNFPGGGHGGNFPGGGNSTNNENSGNSNET